jgi:hypothetical protein
MGIILLVGVINPDSARFFAQIMRDNNLWQALLVALSINHAAHTIRQAIEKVKSDAPPSE